MSPMIEIQADKGQQARLDELLEGIPQGAQRVLSRAVNKVGAAARTEIVRYVSSQINVGVGELRNRNVRMTRANFRDLTARVWVTGSRIPLSRFAASQVRRGVSYRIQRAGGRQMLAGAFLQRMPSGRLGVFARRADSSRAGGRVARYPIDQRFGPSVPHVVENSAQFGQAVLDRRLGEDLADEIDTQTEVLLAQRGRAGK